jgi:hypothetical protein
MLVSISEGFCLEGLLGAILFSELDMLAAGVGLIEDCRLVVVESSTIAPGILSWSLGLAGLSETLVRGSCTVGRHCQHQPQE